MTTVSFLNDVEEWSFFLYCDTLVLVVDVYEIHLHVLDVDKMKLKSHMNSLNELKDCSTGFQIRLFHLLLFPIQSTNNRVADHDIV